MLGVEPFLLEEPTEVESLDQLDTFNEERSVSCSTCGCSLEENNREALAAHYRSGWHKYNAKRVLQGKSAIPEEDYEDVDEIDAIKDDDNSSSDSEEEVLLNRLAPSRAFFVQNDEVFSFYKAILLPGESISPSVFARPLNCAIFVLSGGHFAGAVFKNDQMILHKAIARYVVRAKQGGAQSANDNSKGAAHSAGAALRRYNEKTLRAEIVQILQDWSAQLSETPLIFIRTPTFQKSVFHGENGIPKNDSRLRTIPFETKRPTIAELKRTWTRLLDISSHGLKDDYLKKLASNAKSRQPTALMKRKKEEESWDVEALSRDVDDKLSSSKEPKKKDHIKKVVEAEKETDLWPQVSSDSRRLIYDFIRSERIEELRKFIENKEHIFLPYLSERRFGPEESAFLHIAASNGLNDILMCLLEIGCDPGVRNSENQTPYLVSKTKITRKVFQQFRATNPKAWEWTRCHIPELIEASEDQLQKIAEKKKEKRQRQKEKQKEKKETERKEEAEKAARDEWNALPEREKRARAAEARLAALETKRGDPVPTEKGRCVQCGIPLPKVPFEYCDVQLCTPACVAAHRAKFM